MFTSTSICTSKLVLLPVKPVTSAAGTACEKKKFRFIFASLKKYLYKHFCNGTSIYVNRWEKWCLPFRMYIFWLDIKKLFLLMACQRSLSSGQKTTGFRLFWQVLVKNRRRFIAGYFKAFLYFFYFDFLHIDSSENFCFCNLLAKSLRSEGERL